MSGKGPTLVDLFRASARRAPDRVALKHEVGGSWQDTTWAEWLDLSGSLATALIQSGLQAGQTVAIISATRYEWVIADVAVLLAGGVTVPVYPSLPADRMADLIEDAGCQVVFYEDAVHLSKLMAVRSRMPGVKHAVCLTRQDPAVERDPWFGSLSRWIGRGRAGQKNGDAEALHRRMAAVQPDDLATIVYTSGTTGEPKGVELTHAAFAWECQAMDVLGMDHTDLQLLFLPLAHIVPRLLYLGFATHGGATAFARSPDTVMADAAAVHPTAIGGVPKLWEAVQRGATAEAERGGAVKQRLYSWATSVLKEASIARDTGRKLDLALRMSHTAAMKAVGEPFLARLGGKLRVAISGSAPLSVDTARFLMGFGLEVVDGYGLTETTGATHLNRPGATRLGTVGQPLNGVEARIARDGEVLLRGPNLMRGYHGRPAATTESLDSAGWLHTGDLGSIDSQGYLTITDRRKDLFVTADGHKMAPQAIEAHFRANPYIREVVVHGEGREFLTALITLEHDAVTEWARGRDIPAADFEALRSHPAVYELIEGEVREINSALATFETVDKFAIMDSDFTEQSGELTPTAKLRRRFITEKHADLLDSFYTEGY